MILHKYIVFQQIEIDIINRVNETNTKKQFPMKWNASINGNNNELL